jgi:hypothetical protein
MANGLEKYPLGGRRILARAALIPLLWGAGFAIAAVIVGGAGFAEPRLSESAACQSWRWKSYCSVATRTS